MPNHEGQPQHRPRARRRSAVRWGIGALALLVTGGWGFREWQERSGTERTDNAQIEGMVLPIHARVPGFAVRVQVRDDQKVKAGDTLFSLDPTEYVLRVRQTEAELWAARAAAKGGVAGAGQRVAQAQMAVAESNILSARSNLDKAQREYDRTAALRSRDVASQAQLDGAEAALNAAKAALNAASEQATATGFGEVGAQAQVRLSEARIAAAQAAVDYARAQLGWTAAVAPVSGTVSRKNVEQGQFLTAGQPVLSLVSDSLLWVVANLKETQVERIQPGAPVEVEVDAYPGRKLTGKVRSIQAATGSRFSLLPPDNASGNFIKVVQRVPVRIDLDPSPLAAGLRPGMSASVAIRVSAE